MTAVSELLTKWESETNPWGYYYSREVMATRLDFANELRAAIAIDATATASAENIVRALAIAKRGSEQAHDLAGRAVLWVAENGDVERDGR